ncbi:VWA domain-containing protein [Fictibacillus sp. 23RED33]|uniref:VWA domain-containing protein n=1 Tax=Fictibacillus sp. 23RED33 TaxID=2745879 RepID=UPI0018CE289C|nr:VWA domain-containing protein [Fictibacillus sp. 23RED33]MBH0176157.1 VWA domain-containing protein [Fictibacillus sp. 23RED33]
MKPNNIFIIAVIILLLTISLVACSNDESKGQIKQTKESSVSNDDKAEDDSSKGDFNSISDASKPSGNLEEILIYPTGQFAGLDFRANDTDKNRVLETFKDFPKLDDTTNEEMLDQYWAKMVSLYHEDYPSPDQVLEGIKLQSFGNPELDDERYHFKENLNVEIILDASGSMAAKIGNKTKMELAKDSIKEFASKLPSNANVALRVYGHKGSGNDSDKALSCGSSELVYSLQKFDDADFSNSLNKFKPAGWTPIALALNEAKKDLSTFDSATNTNIIYLVSDGIATCDDDPVKAGQSIANSNIEPIVNILGFDIDSKGQKQLMDIAKASKGTYASVNNAEQLNQELDKAKQIAELWNDWKESADRDAKSQFIDQKFDILYFSNDFAEAYIRENNNYRYTIRHLRDEGEISKKSWRYLDNKRIDRFETMKKYRQDIEKQLDSINEGNLEDAQKELEKLAEENKPK